MLREDPEASREVCMETGERQQQRLFWKLESEAVGQ